MGKNEMTVKRITLLFALVSLLMSQSYELRTFQISLSQKPIVSDSLVLKGALGSNFYQTSDADTLTLKGGLWNIAAGLYSEPPAVRSILPDTIYDNKMPVLARAIATDLNGIAQTNLYVQLGGGQSPIIIPMTVMNDTLFEALIPDSLISIFNLRTHVESIDNMAHTGESGYETPSVEFPENELTMEENYSYYPQGIQPEKWRMFSWPGQLNNAQVNTSSLEDGHVFYDWDPNEGQWMKPDTLKIGKAYWFKHVYRESVVFKNKNTAGLAVPLEDRTLHLHSGWNMVGSPFAFPVQTEYNEVNVSGLYRWGSGKKDGWVGPVDTFEPWAGYAVYNHGDADSIILKPFADTVSASRIAFAGWKLVLKADGENYFDHTGRIGRREDATENKDGFDTPTLPALGNYLSLAMDVEGGGRFDHSVDVRSLDEFNGVWDIQITGKGEPGPVYVSGSILDHMPEELHLAIIDVPRRFVVDQFLQTGLMIEEKITNAYDLKLVAGDEQYVERTVLNVLSEIPEEFSLGQNYPNPFNPLTKIDFALPRTGEAVITIYNILGQEITTLVNQRLNYGYHTVTWRGTDRAGRPVSSGVYFSELRARGFRQTKKMLLLK